MNKPSSGLARPVVATYEGLLQAIRETRTASQSRIETAVEQEKVREAWETGKLIDEHVLQHKERADYGEQVVIKLARDLGTSETELKYMLQFARAYPIRPPADELSWSHYRELLSLNDSKDREEITARAVKEHWNRNRMRKEVRRRQSARKPSQENVSEPALVATRGKVGVYRVIRAKVGPFKRQLALDLGFANYYQPKEVKKFKEGDLVQLEKGKLKSFKGSKDDRYTYPAYVSGIIDGDTFKAVIDLGFGIVTEQKLRLRGLDAPEIETSEGKEAKAFLERSLRSASGGEAISASVLIRTVKSDKYDRYLADVWAGETYINQKLIDEGHALRMEE